MLSIGEFSKICGVTTRTLRHYDDINLIKPKQTSKENGYRFYDVSQIRQMLMINRLKEYDFSLDEITKIISVNDNNYILKKVIAKEREIISKIKQYEEIQKQIKNDILNLERGVDIMAFIDDIEVKLVETKPQHILYSRQRMSIDEYGKYFGKLFELAHSKGMNIAGAPMAIYHDKEFNPADNDTEIALPVQKENENTRLLLGGLCAMGVCKGAYSNLTSVYGKLTEWINKNNYEIVFSPYEQYVKGQMEVKSVDDFLTEIYFPVKKI